MNKYVIYALLLICANNSYAQDLSQKSILELNLIRRDRKKDLSDSLKVQIEDFRQLTDILTEEIKNYSEENQNLKNELHKFLVLTTPDTVIFNQNFKAIGDIPLCLKERVSVINSIIELREKIVSEENVAQELEKKMGKTHDAYVTIREKIEKNLYEIQDLINKIKAMNLNTLSDEQRNYFRPALTDRFNNFSKYFKE